MYAYLKAIHIVFVVTWFAGLFYIVRLFIYNTEANNSPEPGRTILKNQFSIMMRRLWWGIAWPSAIITLGIGLWIFFNARWDRLLLAEAGRWLFIKLVFVFLLYAYHFTLHIIFKQEIKGVFKYSSQQLRIWNEVATIFLVSIVFLATVKQSFSFLWGGVGLAVLIIILASAIKIYRMLRH